MNRTIQIDDLEEFGSGGGGPGEGSEMEMELTQSKKMDQQWWIWLLVAVGAAGLGALGIWAAVAISNSYGCVAKEGCKMFMGRQSKKQCQSSCAEEGAEVYRCGKDGTCAKVESGYGLPKDGCEEDCTPFYFLTTNLDRMLGTKKCGSRSYLAFNNPTFPLLVRFWEAKEGEMGGFLAVYYIEEPEDEPEYLGYLGLVKDIDGRKQEGVRWGVITDVSSEIPYFKVDLTETGLANIHATIGGEEVQLQMNENDVVICELTSWVVGTPYSSGNYPVRLEQAFQ